MNLGESVAKLFSGNVLNAAIQFGAIAGFTRLLGPGPVGSFFVFQTIVGLLGIPSDLGVSRAAEKRLSSDEPAGEVMCTAALLKVALLLPWLVALFLGREHVERYVGVEGVLPFVVAGLIASQAFRLALRLLAGQLRVHQNAILKVAGQTVWITVGFLLVSAGWGARAVIASYVLGRTATVAGALVRLDIDVGRPQLRRARDLFDFGRYALVGDVNGYVYQWLDVAVLRLFVPVSLVGAYEIAWRVASVSVLLTKAIRTSLFPQISNWYARDRLEKIESAFYNWVQVPLYLTIPAFAGGVVLGEDLLRTVFSAEVAVAYPVLLVFMFEKILRSVQLVVGPSLFAMDEPQLGYRGNVAAIFTNLVLNFALVPFFGILGAAVATTVGAAVAAVLAIGYVQSLVPLRVPWSQIGWSVASAAVMALGVYFVTISVPSGITRVALGLAVGTTTYFAMLFVNRNIRGQVHGAIQTYAGS